LQGDAFGPTAPLTGARLLFGAPVLLSGFAVGTAGTIAQMAMADDGDVSMVMVMVISSDMAMGSPSGGGGE